MIYKEIQTIITATKTAATRKPPRRERAKVLCGAARNPRMTASAFPACGEGCRVARNMLGKFVAPTLLELPKKLLLLLATVNNVITPQNYPGKVHQTLVITRSTANCSISFICCRGVLLSDWSKSLILREHYLPLLPRQTMLKGRRIRGIKHDGSAMISQKYPIPGYQTFRHTFP
jgi:hypothetical protein